MVEPVQVLRSVHILAAIAWGGGALYRNHVVSKMMGDDAAASRFFALAPSERYMAISAVATVGLGLGLMGLNSEAYSIDAIGNGAWVLGLGMGAAMGALGLGIAVHGPTDRRLRPLATARAAGHEHDEAAYHALVARENRFLRISVGLVSFAMLTMVTFRYF